jgi:protein tyrosine phosphatase (PTP) superfamily phosphohydrolase (DUF442 family)
MPVGIPQFSSVTDRVATGLRPSLDDGLDWLQTNGYRTLLHLRSPGETSGEDRQQVERRNMQYLSLEISPQAVSRDTVDAFSRVVMNAEYRPLFVYDRDGSLTGGLWYLHFRLAEQLPDEQARSRAASLGFRPDRDAAHQQMWLAIQKYVGEQTR